MLCLFTLVFAIVWIDFVSCIIITDSFISAALSPLPLFISNKVEVVFFPLSYFVSVIDMIRFGTIVKRFLKFLSVHTCSGLLQFKSLGKKNMFSQKCKKSLSSYEKVNEGLGF